MRPRPTTVAKWQASARAAAAAARPCRPRGVPKPKGAHHQPEVEGRGVNQQASSFCPRLDAGNPPEQVRERLQLLAPPPQPPLPPVAPELDCSVGLCASRLPFHFRRPRFGSLT